MAATLDEWEKLLALLEDPITHRPHLKRPDITTVRFNLGQFDMPGAPQYDHMLDALCACAATFHLHPSWRPQLRLQLCSWWHPDSDLIDLISELVVTDFEFWSQTSRLLLRLKELSALKHISVHGYNWPHDCLTTTIGKCSGLTSISLFQCRLPDDAVTALCSLPALQQFTMQRAPLEPNHLPTLLDNSLISTLTLNMENEDPTPMTVQTLAAAIARNTHLTHLTLHMGFSDAVLDAAVAACVSLVVVKLIYVLSDTLESVNCMSVSSAVTDFTVCPDDYWPDRPVPDQSLQSLCLPLSECCNLRSVELPFWWFTEQLIAELSSLGLFQRMTEITLNGVAADAVLIAFVEMVLPNNVHLQSLRLLGNNFHPGSYRLLGTVSQSVLDAVVQCLQSNTTLESLVLDSVPLNVVPLLSVRPTALQHLECTLLPETVAAVAQLVAARAHFEWQDIDRNRLIPQEFFKHDESSPEPMILPAKEVRVRLQRGWQHVSPVIGFVRANFNSALRYSIFPLINDIAKLVHIPNQSLVFETPSDIHSSINQSAFTHTKFFIDQTTL